MQETAFQGFNRWNYLGVLAKATQALAQNEINVNCVSQSLRQVNMQFVIDREKYKEAIIALNTALCL